MPHDGVPRDREREAVTQHSDLRERERELRDTTLNNMHHLRLQRLSLLAAASRGCWRAERGCVYVGKGGRERRPAGQERETAESERERALRFELCVERHPGEGHPHHLAIFFLALAPIQGVFLTK